VQRKTKREAGAEVNISVVVKEKTKEWAQVPK
jgi:hypothetical protein